jgi:serpin B
MKRLAALLLLVGVASCDPATGPGGPPAQLAGLPRDLSADEARVSGAANQFALNLFRRLNAAQAAENVFVSPLSVTFALGMAMNGANGATFNEMRSTLGFGADDLAAINAGYRGLLSLESGLDPSTTFQIANSVWYRQTLPVMPTFVDSMRQVFGADVKSAPFDASTVAAVNSWVSQKTAGRIPTILEGISPYDVMFLINAIYFKGSWRDRFDPARTVQAPFNAMGGAQQVRTMYRPDGVGKLRFRETTAATVGELSYGNGAFVMTIVMPQGDVNAFVATLDTASWRALVTPMVERDFAVGLPKFTLEYKRELKDDLKALGMQTPFIPDSADFTRMSSVGRQLYIAFVQHKTFVDVNEEGTEAAAVTNVGIGLTSAPPCLCVDRPFLFAIRERFSGTILFLGKIVRVPG